VNLINVEKVVGEIFKILGPVTTIIKKLNDASLLLDRIESSYSLDSFIARKKLFFFCIFYFPFQHFSFYFLTSPEEPLFNEHKHAMENLSTINLFLKMKIRTCN